MAADQQVLTVGFVHNRLKVEGEVSKVRLVSNIVPEPEKLKWWCEKKQRKQKGGLNRTLGGTYWKSELPTAVKPVCGYGKTKKLGSGVQGKGQINLNLNLNFNQPARRSS